MRQAPRNRSLLLQARPLVRNPTRRKSRLLTYDPCRPVSTRGGTCHRVCFPPPFWKHVAQPLNGGGPGAGPSGRGGRGGCRDPGLGPQGGRRALSSASLRSAWGRAALWRTTMFPHRREGSFPEGGGCVSLRAPFPLGQTPPVQGVADGLEGEHSRSALRPDGACGVGGREVGGGGSTPRTTPFPTFPEPHALYPVGNAETEAPATTPESPVERDRRAGRPSLLPVSEGGSLSVLCPCSLPARRDPPCRLRREFLTMNIRGIQMLFLHRPVSS